MKETWRPPFEVLGSVDRGVFRVVPSGELDTKTAPVLAHALERAERTHVDIIMLDLRAVTFMDSSGIRCLTAAADRSQRSGERLLIIKGGAQIQRLLDMALIDEALPLI